MIPENYKKMMQEYLEDKIGHEEFEDRFMAGYYSETLDQDINFFEILSGIFSSFQAYSPQATPETEDIRVYITRDTFHKELKEYIAKINDYIKASQGNLHG